MPGIAEIRTCVFLSSSQALLPTTLTFARSLLASQGWNPAPFLLSLHRITHPDCLHMEAHGAGPRGRTKEVLHWWLSGAGGPILCEDTRNLQGDSPLGKLQAECVCISLFETPPLIVHCTHGISPLPTAHAARPVRILDVQISIRGDPWGTVQSEISSSPYGCLGNRMPGGTCKKHSCFLLILQ